jgi:hypothetical protein
MKQAFKIGFLLVGVAGVLFLSGCIRVSTQQGVDNVWRDPGCPEFTSGQTTQTDVMAALGPPSQILSLQNGTAFYYLREYGNGSGLFLLIYNERTTRSNYDRAVFFFNSKGVLTDFSYSAEQAPRP